MFVTSNIEGYWRLNILNDKNPLSVSELGTLWITYQEKTILEIMFKHGRF